MKVLFLLLSSFFIFGCKNSKLPDVYRLDRFRVLALHADAPEVSPGQTVIITPYVSDVLGEGRALTFSAWGCLDPGVGVGALPECKGSPSEVVLAQHVTASGLAAPDYTGPLTTTVNVTIPAQAVVFEKVDADTQFNGVSYLVVFDFEFTDGTSFRAYRTLLVSTRSNKNQNPVFEMPALVFQGQSLTAEPQTQGEFEVNLDPVSAETYSRIENGQTVSFEESPFVAWYISKGELTSSLTDFVLTQTLFTPETSALPFVVVAVAKDGRGGDTVVMERF